MGAHGTFEDALANVTSFVSASKAPRLSSDSHPSKHKSHKKHKKAKDKTKDKHRKHKKSKRRSSSDDSSDNEQPHLDLDAQLAKGREAARITRLILTQYPEMRADLREGIYTKPSHADSLVLFLSPVFEEMPAQLATDVSAAPGTAEHTAQLSGHEQGQQAPTAAVHGHFADTELDATLDDTAAASPAALGSAAVEGPATALPDAVIGPSMPAAPSQDAPAANAASNAAVDGPEGQPEAGRRRAAIGPAMPPPELLAAAALMPWQDDEEDAEDMIGPAPPEMAEELDGVGGDERVAEVVRVIRLLSSASEGSEADAYDIMGVEPTATSAELKRRYWRLSLLIHPDKCSHPRANDAFQAVSKVSKELQDSEKRKAIDAAREDARLGKIASALADEEERNRQWRVARGEATAEDLAGPVRRGPQPRDAWMTDLPPERVPTTLAPKGNQTSFSQQGIRSRGDTSEWTMTPAQRLLQLQGGSSGQQAIAAGPSWEQDPRKAAQTAAAVDAYLSANRQKSLLEQHNDRKAKKRKAEAADGKSNGPDKQTWEGKHPWRPFDREKDLNIASKPVNQQDVLKKAGSLSGRFGTSSGQRTFL